ncbi:MAG: hypothetical protein EPO21_20325 [Chloroflexota bacterium]|nr:MAG: hypothetical protein EPO21_20325 [Chloroflexota bacterium]
MLNCPGSSSLKQATPESIACPHCGTELEIWSDEVKTTCTGCKATVFKAQGQSCIDWCKFARQCVGDEVYERMKGSGSQP